MTFLDWAKFTASYYRDYGVVGGTRCAAKNTWHSALSRADPHIGGWNIYDDDWDLLIIVDACRADLMAEVAPKYDWLPDKVDSRRSVATATRPWMKRTFVPENAEEMAETDYVVGNPYSTVMLNPADFNTLDEVHQYAWDDEYGTVHPRPVTERAVDLHRRQGANRLLVHYLPPHFPSIPDYLGYNMSKQKFEEADPKTGVEWDGVWEAARAGEIAPTRIWKSYRANLEYVLDDIEILLENIDANRGILASDHGNAMGEWWTWGHPPNVFVPINRRVPYIEVEANDEETLSPTLGQEVIRDARASTNQSVENQLKALGYT